MANEKWSEFPEQLTITSGSSLVGLDSGANVSFNPFSFGQDLLINSLTFGQGGFTEGLGSNLAVGNSALANNVSGIYNCAVGIGSLQGVIASRFNCGFGGFSGLNNEGNNNIFIGFQSGFRLGLNSNGNDNTLIGSLVGNGGGNSSGLDFLGGSGNTWIGEFVTGSDNIMSGTIGIGKWATPDPTTGSDIGSTGPGIAIGSSSFPVGFRGDGTSYPAGSANYWRMKINDTYYKLPILPDNTTITWPSSGALATTSSVVVLAPSADQTITGGYSLVVADTGNLQASSGNLISGSSGHAGFITSFPATAALGSISFVAANNAGNFANILTNLSSSAARTWSLPDSTGTIALTSQLPSSGTPLVALSGGTGVSNSFNLTISAASSINQNVTTTGTPIFSGITVNGTVAATGQITSGTSTGGTGGLLSLISPTAAKGFFKLTCMDNAGFFTVQMQNASFGQTSILTIPDPASSTASFILNKSSAGQTINSGLSVVGNFATTPAVSASSSLILGTAYQNTLGYDIVLTVYLSISAATSASILLGIGPTNTPTQQTIISGLTLATIGIVPITIYLPNNYYALLSTSGTITLTISGQQGMPV